jgi:hypothetical protein
MRPSCDSSGVLPKNTTRMSDRLNAKPREVTVVYCDSDKAPCACFADGVAIAAVASVGQRTCPPEKGQRQVGRVGLELRTSKIRVDNVPKTLTSLLFEGPGAFLD